MTLALPDSVARIAVSLAIGNASYARYVRQPEHLLDVSSLIFPTLPAAVCEWSQPSFDNRLQGNRAVRLASNLLPSDVQDAVVPNQRVPTQRRAFRAFSMKFSRSKSLKST